MLGTANLTLDVPARNARTCSSVVSFVSLMSITMAPMIDPFTPLQTKETLKKSDLKLDNAIFQCYDTGISP